MTNEDKPTAEYQIQTEDGFSLLCEDGAELLIDKSLQEIINTSKP